MTLTSAESLGIPSLDTDVSDADWTSEIATGSADSSLKFGKRELKPSPLAKRIKVSNKLIRIGSMPVEALVQQRLGYKFAVTEEKAFQSGNGVGKPLGLFVASNDGISTGRDVSSGANAFSAADAAASKVSADALIDMKFKLKGQYGAAPSGFSTATSRRSSPSSSTATVATSSARACAPANPTPCSVVRSTCRSSPRTPTPPANTSACSATSATTTSWMR